MPPLQLEPFTEADFDRFIHWITSLEEMVLFAGPTFHYPVTHEQLKRHIVTENRKFFRVRYGDQIVGHAEMICMPANESLRLGLLLIGEPAMRGKGLGKALVTALLREAFETMAVHRVELNVYDFNKAAIACYEHVGFQREGVLRENHKVGDQFWSTIVMGMLKYEWESRK